VQALLVELPQAVPLDLFVAAWQEPPLQTGAFLQSVAEPQEVPLEAWLLWQVPLPLQVSGLVQALLVLLPHDVPDEAWLALQVPF